MSPVHDSQAPKQHYHQPEFRTYGTIRDLTTAQEIEGEPDNPDNPGLSSGVSR